MDLKPRLSKQVNNKIEMETWENIFILKNKGWALNFEIPPADILIKKFILQTPEATLKEKGWKWRKTFWNVFPYKTG